MSPLLTAFFAALPMIMQDIPSFQTLWNLLKPGAPPTDAAAIDAVLAALVPKTVGDLTQLATDATAAAAAAAVNG